MYPTHIKKERKEKGREGGKKEGRKKGRKEGRKNSYVRLQFGIMVIASTNLLTFLVQPFLHI
jgi:flagellar biosynthesis/type III secretory pathway protein FliH